MKRFHLKEAARYKALLDGALANFNFDTETPNIEPYDEEHEAMKRMLLDKSKKYWFPWENNP